MGIVVIALVVVAFFLGVLSGYIIAAVQQLKEINKEIDTLKKEIEAMEKEEEEYERD
jgi:uncharacterized protein YoxC